MDRKPRLVLHPTANGWKGTVDGAGGPCFEHEAASLAEAAEACGGAVAERPLTLAIPSRSVIFERMTLPCAEGEELRGMIRLQFEKSLPHPAEEMVFGWETLRQHGSETTLMACAIYEPELAELFAPLGGPGNELQLAPWAMLVAAQAAGAEPSCAVWREGEAVLFGVFQARRLVFIEAMRDPFAEIARVLISAGMAGAPTRFEKLFVDPALASDAGQISSLVGAPVAEWTSSALELVPCEAVDFVPEKWHAKAREAACGKRRRARVVTAAAIYFALLIVGAVSIGLGQHRLASIERQITTLHPTVDGLIARQTRWNALAPAVDRERFLVELLFQTCQAFASPETRLTRFELVAQNQLVIEGEAADARQAIAFAEALKTRPSLGAYRFESGPPVILSNEHAQFRILGKL